MLVKNKFVTDHSRWEAIKRRNKRADGQFFYSVKTTGVYCRPSCASRWARRENVRFHSSCEEAEAAGFRPCKRCQPKNDSFGNENITLVTKACRLIESSQHELSLNELASHAGLSPFHFQRIFKKITGVTPKSYAISHRATKLKQKLRQTKSVTDAIFASGFKSNGQFYAISTDQLGMTAKEFRAGANKLEIQFGFGKSSLGIVLVATTVKGICAIFLGDSREKLIDELKNTFPRAQISTASKQIEKSIVAAVKLVDDPRAKVELPLDIRGTAFQHRVWKALQKIPLGSTRTYTQIAQEIGDKKSIRAVARACATNSIAVAIPCHRVIRADGNLAGYRWGLMRKQKLLDREKKR